MIEARGLRKSYGAVEVLRGVDLAVPEGGLLALLGPNGAGKTTTVRILATLTRPDAGWARVAGLDVVGGPPPRAAGDQPDRPARGRGRAPDRRGEPAMTARLAGLRRAAARARTRELLERFGLSDAAARRVETYSGGMRRRLDLAAGLVGRPAVMFLDEPTTGLDPRSRETVWASVAELRDAGVTVLLTTQYLEEADRLADRIAILDAGRIVADGTAAELKRRVAEKRLELVLRRRPHRSTCRPMAARRRCARCSTSSIPAATRSSASRCASRPSTTSSSP